MAAQFEGGVGEAGGGGKLVSDAEAQAAFRTVLQWIGEDPTRDGLRDTPARVARSYAEMFSGLRQSAEDVLSTTFDLGHDEMVLVKDIEVYSTCEHHLVPFHGVAHVGYLPGERIVGLSKLARLVEHFAARPQVQERLTKQVAECLASRLRAPGVGVVLEAEHSCMTLRGVRAHGAKTVTSALLGTLRADPASRAEFFALAGVPRLAMAHPEGAAGKDHDHGRSTCGPEQGRRLHLAR